MNELISILLGIGSSVIDQLAGSAETAFPSHPGVLDSLISDVAFRIVEP